VNGRVQSVAVITITTNDSLELRHVAEGGVVWLRCMSLLFTLILRYRRDVVCGLRWPARVVPRSAFRAGAFSDDFPPGPLAAAVALDPK
jgi:hypothetical protein